MYHPTKFWDNTKNQPDLWFFYGFLFTFTLTIRKVLLFYPIQKEFNEYASIYLYLSDIFLFLTLFFWALSILCNKNIKLSIKNASLTYFYNAIKKLFSKWHLSIPLVLVIWSFLSTTWAQNQSIALFKSIKLLELCMIYTYVIHKMSTYKNKTSGNLFLKDLCKIIIVIAMFQSIIAIGQFTIQHSLSLFWLKESLISPSIPGVAKFIFNGDKYIRAYGLFPHPNILGGFLLVSILLTYYYQKFFHTCPSIFPHLPAEWVGGTIWNITLALQFIALLLTFSKSATIGLLIAFLYINIYNIKYKYIHIVPRGTFLKFTIIAILVVVLFTFAKIDANSFFLKSLYERINYLNVSRGTILDNPITGLGFGQFVLHMQNYSLIKLQIWQFQPVHNVFLLIWSELGLAGLGLFIVFLWKLFYACPPNRWVEQFYLKTSSHWKGEGREGIEKHSVSINNTNTLQSSLYPLLTKEGRKTSFSTPARHCSTPARRVGGWNNLKYRLLNIFPRLPVIVPRLPAEWVGGTILPLKHQKFLLNTLFKAILLGFIFIMLFDHYLWDIHQGQVILWITLGLAAGISQKTEKEPVY